MSTFDTPRPAVNPSGTIVGFGELLLRLKAPGASQLLQTPSLEATFGGAELNVLASLSRFGWPTELVTVLPINPVGSAGFDEIRRWGVGTRYVRRHDGRMGMYYLEAGADIRPGRVIYDRANSAFASLEREWCDWEVILAGARWLHLTGITAALGAHPWASLVTAARTAKRLGVPLSLDVNTRPALWAASGRSAREALRAVLETATLIFAGVDDRHVCLDPDRAQDLSSAGAPEFLEQLLETYPQAEAAISTLRRAETVECQQVSAVAQVRSQGFVHARTIELSAVVDRVGAGDAFVAGCLHGILKDSPWQTVLDFGVTAGALKHTIPGDVNRTSLEDITASLAGRDAGRLQR